MILIEEALNQTYIVRSNKNGKGYASGKIMLPKCLIGKKISISIIENIDEEIERARVESDQEAQAKEEEEVQEDKNIFQKMWEGSDYSK